MGQLDIFSLAGRVALVPGGGGGIGSALAEALAGAGARVAVAGRTRDTCEATVERIRAAGSEGLAIRADMTSEADCDRMVRETLERFGRIDIIVNAVGGGAGKALHPAEAYPRSDWDWIMELNVRSTVLATQPAVRAMSHERQKPKPMPATPPATEISTDSVRNCRTMSLRRAPAARRTPISCVRSSTVASTMFMIPMPPTSSEMAAIATIT